MKGKGKSCRQPLPALLAWLVLLSPVLGIGQGSAGEVLLREEFAHLDRWEPYYFKGIERHSQYRSEVLDGRPVLVARSDGSASALISKERFSPQRHPVLHWRWRVDKVYAGGNYRQKSGDDYPLRVYVLFAYDPAGVDLATRLKYQFAKTLFGQYPPHSSINYIWANRAEEREPVANPYTDRTVMVPLRQGPEQVGRWLEETVNIFEDYQRLFGEPPPPLASLAIMNDSDNTGEAATSYLEFIELRSQ